MKLQLARGVRDIPPEEKILKNEIIDTLKNVFQNYGFLPLETPIIERLDTLIAKFGAGSSSDVAKEMFKLTDQGKRNLGLRFELTTSLGRYVAMNPNVKMPFKRYEIGPVFRDGPIKAGRTRQFWQCDFDLVGSNSMLADAECLAILNNGFKKLNINAVIKVNNRKILNGILEKSKIDDKEAAIIAIDKLEKIGEEGVRKELKEKGFKKNQMDKCFSLLNLSLPQLKKELDSEGILEMEELLGYVKQLGLNVKFDVSLARGLAYYTGTIFEVFAKNSKITSSIAAGGRYDNMIGSFIGGGRVVPAVGGSFGIVPILEILKEKELKKTLTQVYIIPMGTVKESLKIASELRESGVPTDFSLKKGMSKNLQYANSLNIPYVIIIGEDELKKNKVLLRDMKTGDQKLLSIEQVIKKLK